MPFLSTQCFIIAYIKFLVGKSFIKFSCGEHLTCKIANRCLNVRKRVEVVEWNKSWSPPFPCCPVNRQCLWKKTLIEKKIKQKKEQTHVCIFLINSPTTSVLFLSELIFKLPVVIFLGFCNHCVKSVQIRSFFPVRIFPHSDWIQSDTEYLSLFSPNSGKYRLEKTLYLDTFHSVNLWATTNGKAYFSGLLSTKLVLLINRWIFLFILFANGALLFP